MRSNASYVINPDAFSVNPALVGLPLARPARRLTAMLIDLAVVSILVHAGGGVLLGLAAVWVAFRFAGRLSGKGRGMSLVVRGMGGLFLFLLALNLWNRGRDFASGLLNGEGDTPGLKASVGSTGVPVNGRQALDITRLVMADDEEEARRLAPGAIRGLRAAGMEDDAIRDVLLEGNEDGERPWMTGMLDSLMPAPRAAAAPRVDSLAAAYAAAAQAGDSATLARVGPLLGSRLAADSLRELRAEQTVLHRQVRDARKELEEAQNRGIVSRITGFLDEMGIGFGWSGLYFTAFVAMWNGQTPGKRLMGIRVVRLNGQPMNLWTSFERFGGYAAGLVTGLLGFAQVYWDHNRMMIHDKIIETVVVRDRRPGEPPRPAAPAGTAALTMPLPSPLRVHDAPAPRV